MEHGCLRQGQAEEYLKAKLDCANEAVKLLGFQLYSFGDSRSSVETQNLLRQAANSSPQIVEALADAIAPGLGKAIAEAWKRLHGFPVALPGWTAGEPVLVEQRAHWLRDLLIELARYELPTTPDDALRWLALHSGDYVEVLDKSLTNMVGQLLGRTAIVIRFHGCDHVGRLLASEMARNTPVSQDIFNTLKLIGSCRHTSVRSDMRMVAAPHVAYGLAGCGLEGATEALCETFTVDRQSAELTVAATALATSAALEVFRVFPDVLPCVLTTLAQEIGRGQLDPSAIGQQLPDILALPDSILTHDSCASILQTCASALRDHDYRQGLIASENEVELFIGLWAESIEDVAKCGQRLVERYEEAARQAHSEVKNVLRLFAKFREGNTLAMRPLWIRILREATLENAPTEDGRLAASVLSFNAAAGISCPIPPDSSDDAFELLIELERRVRGSELQTEIVNAGGFASAMRLQQAMIKMIVANLAGRPAEVLFPLVKQLHFDDLHVLATANFTKADSATLEELIIRAKPIDVNGFRIMIGAVAAINSLEALIKGSMEKFNKYSINPSFALACALRTDRLEFWRQLLQAGKKDRREHGLSLISTALKTISISQQFPESQMLRFLPNETRIDAESILRDASRAISEYAATQAKKKNGDDPKWHKYQEALELSRTGDERDRNRNESQQALTRLCERVSQITGIAPERFIPSEPQPPRDRGISFVECFGHTTQGLIEAASQYLVELDAQELSYEEHIARLASWFETQEASSSESNQMALLRARNWLSNASNWSYFDTDVLARAKALLTTEQTQRLTELRPPKLSVPNLDRLRLCVAKLPCDILNGPDELLLKQIDWYESVLANLPEPVLQAGHMAENPASPHPPHNHAIATVYQAVCLFIKSEDVERERKVGLIQRIWPLQWWTAASGNLVKGMDISGVTVAASTGIASLSDLVGYLVQPGYKQRAENLINAVQHPERWTLALDVLRDEEILAVIKALEVICREQERAADSSLPSTLIHTWSQLPIAVEEIGLIEVLRKYAQVPFQSVGSVSDQQRIFDDRLHCALLETKKTWTVAGSTGALDTVDFEKLDQWQAKMCQELRELIDEKTISEDQLLRIAFEEPVVLRSVMMALGRSDQLEAAIWIAFHASCSLGDLAITLDASTGHDGLRQKAASIEQTGKRLRDHYAPELASEDRFRGVPGEFATIRRRWQQTAIDAHPRKQITPLLKVLKAVIPSTERLRVEGLLQAMDGKFNVPTARQKLIESIKDRPTLALLQLAVMPLPEDRQAMLTDISERMKVIEALWQAGLKRKSGDAKRNIQRAVDQARRTLADNAGMTNPEQLDELVSRQ